MLWTKLFPDRPVLLVAIDVHSAWINSKAMELAGVNAKTPDPVPGFSYFQKDPKTGEPTGWVVETPAEQAVLAKLTPPTPEAQIAEAAALLPKLSAAGITAVFEAGIATMPAETGYDGYQQLEKENKLPVRVVGTYYWNNPEEKDPVEPVLKLRDKYKSELVQVKTLKIMMDGGEAQHTAVLLKPYYDRPGFNAQYQLDPELVEAAVLKAQQNGVDTHCHCYGDAAIRTYLDIVAKAEKQYPNSPSRHTIAHSLLITDQDVPRYKELNVTMQTSPQWITPDPYSEKVTQILGNEVVNSRMGAHELGIEVGRPSGVRVRLAGGRLLLQLSSAGCDTGSFDTRHSAAIREDSIHAHHAAGDRAHHAGPGAQGIHARLGIRIGPGEADWIARSWKAGRHRGSGKGPVQDSSQRHQHDEGEDDYDEREGDLPSRVVARFRRFLIIGKEKYEMEEVCVHPGDTSRRE